MLNVPSAADVDEAAPAAVETYRFGGFWPNGIVSEGNLTQHVSMLRGLLGESARRHAHVSTVPTRGYPLGVSVERKVGLRMKQVCERCRCLLEPNADARICSYECTFCPDCAAGLAATCPNCGGELVARPPRVSAAS